MPTVAASRLQVLGRRCQQVRYLFPERFTAAERFRRSTATSSEKTKPGHRRFAGLMQGDSGNAGGRVFSNDTLPDDTPSEGNQKDYREVREQIRSRQICAVSVWPDHRTIASERLCVPDSAGRSGLVQLCTHDSGEATTCRRPRTPGETGFLRGRGPEATLLVHGQAGVGSRVPEGV